MNCKKLLGPACLAVLGVVAIVGSFAIADSAADSKDAAKAEFKLPPGWTPEDMQKCMIAGTPGKNHEHLAKGVGKWRCKTTMWMTPGGEAMESEGTSTVTPIMDGRYFKAEMEGEMPGMGPYHGAGVYGYDNVSKEFVSSWIDNHSTGIMQGKGKLSDDGKKLSWDFTANCPITGKPTVMREIETITGPNTKTLEMFGTEPKSGKEFKMMSIQLTKE
jgi:hypothetical protein